MSEKGHFPTFFDLQHENVTAFAYLCIPEKNQQIPVK